jgi:hypothetical protein
VRALAGAVWRRLVDLLLLAVGVVAVLSLSGCAAPRPAPAVVCPEPPSLAPFAALALPAQAPARAYVTNADLVRYAWDLESALGACNADKEALGEWMR